LCGIVGIAGSILPAQKHVFTDLLIADAVRGKDSTGVAFCDGGRVSIHKKFGNPHELMAYRDWSSHLAKINSVLLGHNRWATQGAVNNINAHPFQFNNIVGVHNGTLKNQHLLPDSRLFEVDSENIYHSIDKIGLKETCGKLHGAYALVFYDSKEGSINFVRNKERPLSYCFSEDGKSLFWASESQMLKWALVRNGIKHKKIVNVDVHTHYRFIIPTYLNSGNSMKFTKPLTQKMPKYDPPPVKTVPYVPPYNGSEVLS